MKIHGPLHRIPYFESAKRPQAVSKQPEAETPQKASFAKTLQVKQGPQPPEAVFSNIHGRLDLSQVLTAEERHALNQLFAAQGQTFLNESYGESESSKAVSVEIGSQIDLKG